MNAAVPGREEDQRGLPAIPAKRYFTIGEVSELCGVKPHVLRYWEQEFTQLRPMKRRGNRRYYQHHEVLLVRRIRDLLYEQGFTISGARNRLGDPDNGPPDELPPQPAASPSVGLPAAETPAGHTPVPSHDELTDVRADLLAALDALSAAPRT